MKSAAHRVLLMVAAALAFATAHAQEPPDAGRDTFLKLCASCHGKSGRGDGPMAAGLPTQPANIREHFGDHSFEEMARRVTEGIPPTMPPAPIPPDEVQQALSYVWSLIPDSAQARLRALQELAAEEH